MYKHIMLAVNLNHRSSWKGSLPTALSLLEHFPAQLHVIAVVQDFSNSFVSSFFPENFQGNLIKKGKEQLQEFVQQNVPQEFQSRVQPIVGFGSVEDEIIKYVKALHIDLLIMSDYRAKHKKGMFSHPHISAIKNHISCSMLIDRK